MISQKTSRLAAPMWLGASMVLLAGCSSRLPGVEADAFKTIAMADRDVLENLAEIDQTAKVRYVQRALAGDKVRIAMDSACGPKGVGECIVTFSLDKGAELQLGQPAGNSRALLGSIALYGQRMAELAEAKDLETVKAKAESAGGAVKSLALTAGLPPIVAPIVDLFVWSQHQSLVNKRRSAMLVNARAAQVPLKQAADQLDAILLPMQRIAGRDASREVGDIAQRLAAAQNEHARLSAAKTRSAWRDQKLRELEVQKAEDLNLLLAATTRVNALRAIDTTFQNLPAANEALIKKLENPDYPIEDALAQLNQILVLIDKIEAASK